MLELLLTVTDYRIIFIISIQTNYVSTLEHISQAQNFLTELIKIINLDLLEDVWYVLEELKLAKQYEGQNPESPPDYTDELYNMNNQSI